MVVQSITILVVLVYVNYFVPRGDSAIKQYFTYFRNFCVWTTVIVTVFSGLAYVQRAVAVYRRQSATSDPGD
jgi:hypothetical protein